MLLAKQRRRRETLPPAAKAWGYLQDWMVAYGYRPGRAAVWMAVLWAAGTVAFAQHTPPSIKGEEHPQWNPALYALDLLIPVINLGQDGYWRMEDAWQWGAAAWCWWGGFWPPRWRRAPRGMLRRVTGRGRSGRRAPGGRCGSACGQGRSGRRSPGPPRADPAANEPHDRAITT
ncbi:hypothetical protein SCALM49S_02040 [Streptomyces californicus]